jgi:hypothetical protein
MPTYVTALLKISLDFATQTIKKICLVFFLRMFVIDNIHRSFYPFLQPREIGSIFSNDQIIGFLLNFGMRLV